jgi:adenylylsulfate kinase-like enzyme
LLAAQQIQSRGNCIRGLNKGRLYRRRPLREYPAVGEIAELFVDAAIIVLCSFISPFRAERAELRGMLKPYESVEIFVSTPLLLVVCRWNFRPNN